MAKMARKPWLDPQVHSKHRMLQGRENRTISININFRRDQTKSRYQESRTSKTYGGDQYASDQQANQEVRNSRKDVEMEFAQD